jgi:hypothetical protein
VADQQDPPPTAVAREPADDRRPELPGRVGPGLDLGAEIGQEAGDVAADLVDAVRRVAAAVNVDQALEVGEERRFRVPDRGLERGQLLRGDGRAGCFASLA